MPSSTVFLQIPAEEFLRLYRGEASVVVATAEDGRTIQFPAHCLRRFVTRDGIRGRFEIEYGADRRFRGVRRLPEPGRL